MLKGDHRLLKDLFDQFQAGDGRSRPGLAEQALCELNLHSAIEEEIFYPAVREAVADERLMIEAAEEHRIMAVLVAELEEMLAARNTRVDFQALFVVLADYVRHHIAEEEIAIFPFAAKMPAARRALIGERILARRMGLDWRPLDNPARSRS